MGRKKLALLVPALLVGLAGCGTGSDKAVVIDLDKVLDIFVGAVKTDMVADSGQQPPDVKSHDQARVGKVLKTFETKLNSAKLIEYPIKVGQLSSGAIEGNADVSGTTKKVFTIEIDAENNRVIASQTIEGDTYRRPRPFMGFFGGYLLGSMMFRQNSFYTGSRIWPNYGSMQMNQRGYTSGAMSKAQTKINARTRSGSRSGGGFRFGK